MMTTQTPELDLTLGAIAARRPASIPVFERLGLDYCCGGSRTLAAACEAADLQPVAVLEALAAEERAPGDAGHQPDWTNVSMTELADHIEQTHHAFVRDATIRLKAVMPRVVAAHAKNNPKLVKLAEVVEQFTLDMAEHMVREERVLFPWLRRLERPTEIQSGPPWSVRRPIDCMVHDHEDAGAALAHIRALTDNYTPPPGACATYRSMLSTLQQLELDTHIHVHKENNILFPDGVRAEERRAAQEQRRASGDR